MGTKYIPCGSSQLSSLGYNTVTCEVKTKRLLTAGEIAMAKTVFQNSINYSNIYIHDDEYLPLGLQQNQTTMAPNGEIYFPKDNYQQDFSKASDGFKHHFIHEMTHVWQYQLGYPVAIQGTLLRPTCFLKGINAYHYTLDNHRKLSNYNMEQQGNIISDYYVELVSLKSSAKANKSYTFLDYQRVLSHFIRNPSDVKNLPKISQDDYKDIDYDYNYS